LFSEAITKILLSYSYINDCSMKHTASWSLILAWIVACEQNPASFRTADSHFKVFAEPRYASPPCILSCIGPIAGAVVGKKRVWRTWIKSKLGGFAS
jgi:hypothetical protein